MKEADFDVLSKPASVLRYREALLLLVTRLGSCSRPSNTDKTYVLSI